MSNERKEIPAKHIKEEDVRMARLYREQHPELDRGELGLLLEREGLGDGHHTHSGCADKVEYINLILDVVMPE